MPSYLKNADALKAAGVSDVLLYSTDNACVMGAFAKKMATEGTIIKMLADPTYKFTRAIGRRHPLPILPKLLGRPVSTQRLSMLVDDGVVMSLHIEGVDDAAAEACYCEQMLKDLSA